MFESIKVEIIGLKMPDLEKNIWFADLIS